MSIEQRCKEQQVFADKIFMDFKYTQAGSKEQIDALESRVTVTETEIDDLEGLDINSAISLLQTARQDIIDLKSKVNTLELTSFLIME